MACCWCEFDLYCHGETLMGASACEQAAATSVIFNLGD